MNLKELICVLEKEDFLGEQLEAVRELQNKVSENEVIISVIGQFKRGKSSLINAMLGEELLPTAIIPLTTVVTEIRFGGAFRGEVSFTSGQTKEISREELEDYCSEQKNPGNHKQVETVRLWTSKQPFGEGIVLVDTPGVGSVHQHNTQSSYDYVKRSDGVIFLLSVDSPVSETERDFLLTAREYAAKFFFAVNKADMVSPKDLEVFREFCQNVISDTMGSSVTLRPVSAATGAGVQELTEQLSRELTKSHQGLLEASVEKKLDIIKGQARAKLSLAMKASDLPAEELSRKLNRIRDKQSELDSFAEEVEVLARHRTDLLVDRIQEEFVPLCEKLVEESKQEALRIYQENQNLSAREFEQVMQAQLDSFLKEKLNGLNTEGISSLEEGYGKIVALLSEKAEAAAHFISDLLMEEFGLDYPVNESTFQLSDKSDFFLSIGASGTLLLNMQALARLLPKKIANRRFYEQSIQQAQDDIDRNRNNMLYNYRYKMKESLRTLCRELTEKIQNMAREIDGLMKHVQNSLENADRQREIYKENLALLIKELS